MKKILVDTSIWIEYFKGRQSVIDMIHDIRNYEIFIIGPVIAELIMGIKTTKEKEQFSLYISAIPKIMINDDVWIMAGMIGNSLLKKGITISIPDLIIFCAAKKNNCAIFTLDKHFRLIKDSLRDDIEIINTHS